MDRLQSGRHTHLPDRTGPVGAQTTRMAAATRARVFARDKSYI